MSSPIAHDVAVERERAMNMIVREAIAEYGGSWGELIDRAVTWAAAHRVTGEDWVIAEFLSGTESRCCGQCKGADNDRHAI